MKKFLIMALFSISTFAKECPEGMILWKAAGESAQECKCPSTTYISTDISKKPGKMGGCNEIQNVTVPKDIITTPSDSLVLWLDANDPFGNGYLPGQDSKIQQWFDKSGKGNHAIQENPSKSPIFTKSYLNGGATGTDYNGRGAFVRNEVFFDGNDDFLSIENQTIFNVDDRNYVILAVIKPTELNQTRVFFESKVQKPSRVTKSLSVTANGSLLENWPSLGLESATSTFKNKLSTVLTITYTESSGSILRINGTQVSSKILSKSAFENEQVTISSSSYGWKGSISEIIIFKTNLNSAQIMALEQYLINKWGV